MYIEKKELHARIWPSRGSFGRRYLAAIDRREGFPSGKGVRRRDQTTVREEPRRTRGDNDDDFKFAKAVKKAAAEPPRPTSSKELTAYRRPRSPCASCIPYADAARRRNGRRTVLERLISCRAPFPSDPRGTRARRHSGSGSQKLQTDNSSTCDISVVRSTPGVSRLDGSHATGISTDSRGGRSAPRRLLCFH